jgi:hypothetical protein
MIGSLVELVFSNLWFFLLLFFIFRFVIRIATQQRGMDRENEPSLDPRTPEVEHDPWNFDIDWPEASNESEVKVEPEQHMQSEFEKAHPEEAETRRRPQKEQVRIDPEPLHVEGLHHLAAVQGMMWSQIYGPPRSVAPYKTRKRIKR